MKIPSKTYLLGEYIVLNHEPCLILNTPPYFEANTTDKKDTKNSSHPQSSAGLWIQKNAHFFENTQIDFFDPHEGKGGFGASGAEFIAVYAAQHGIEKNIDWLERMLENYRSVAISTNGILPSGADLVAQVCGSPTDPSIIYWHRAKKQLDHLTWPFSDLSYCLIRSGYKCPTHQYIKKIPDHTVSEMSQVVEEGYSAFQTKNAAIFIDAIKNYANWMKKENCLFEKTEELIQFLYRSNLIQGAKGCGALGADVILVLLYPEKMPAFLGWLKERQMIPAAVG